MTMPVTDRQLAAMRAQLAGRPDEHRRLLGQLDWSTEAVGYTALLDAAFVEAVSERFGAQTPDEDIASFAAGVSSRPGQKVVDPETAERLIGHALGRGSTDDIDPRTALRAKQHILVALVADQGAGDAALDQLLDRARKLADQWLA